VRRARVVIVGGGVVGASVAWHLASRGFGDILVLESGPGPGSGSTGAATGGYRAQFATAINVQLSLLSRAKLRAFPEEIGADSGYRPAGYLWLASDEDQLAALRAAREVQQACGLTEAVDVGVDDIARLQPAVALDGIIGGAYCPTDGFIKPRAILEGYLSAAVRLGVRVHWNESVVGLELTGRGTIERVTTATDAVACDVVVNAAGAWAGQLARMARIDLPVTPLRRHLAPTMPTRIVPPEAPMTLYSGDGFHFRERDGRVLLGWPPPHDPTPAFETTVDPDWLTEVAWRKEERVPSLRDVPLDRDGAWAGLYEMSPDKHAILGALEGCPNFYCINGSSGHGVMHAPALGQLLAEIVTDGRALSLDVSPLAPDRFLRGRPLPSSEVL
jgi:sarcosine oxidase subunit beta